MESIIHVVCNSLFLLGRGGISFHSRERFFSVKRYILLQKGSCCAVQEPGLQIKNAGHAVVTQYPEELGKILNTFLSTIPNN